MSKKALSLILIIILFFLPRLVLINTYPPFNDESIHLAWAGKMVNDPAARFVSMKWGGKQPLPFWLFGTAERLLPNNLFLAGRLVSLGFSLLALIGIYKLTLLVAHSWDKKERTSSEVTISEADSSDDGRGKKNNYLAAIFASIAFALSPYAIFVGVQVLMEIMVFAAAVWSLYFLILTLIHAKIKDAVITGALLGIGFWFKSTMIIFIGLAFLTLFATIFTRLIAKKETQAKKLRFPTIAMSISLALVLLPLITHPSFAYLSQWNKLYGFSFTELAHFPISRWLTNMLIGLTWYLWYLTPFFFLVALWPASRLLWICRSRIGMKLRSGKKTNSYHLGNTFLLTCWFFAAYLVTAVVIRAPSLRYFLPSTFPLFPLFGLSLAKICNSYDWDLNPKRPDLRRSSAIRKILSLNGFLTRSRIYTDNKQFRLIHNLSKKSLLMAFVFVPMWTSSVILSWRPHTFILWLNKFAPFTNDRFHLVSGWPSGYGVPEAIDFIDKQSKKSPLTLLIRYDSGNPEDAMITAFLENPRVKIQMIGELPEKEKEIIISRLKKQPLPVFFVSRGGQLAGLNNYLTEERHFNKPASDEYVGVYKLKVQN